MGKKEENWKISVKREKEEKRKISNDEKRKKEDFWAGDEKRKKEEKRKISVPESPITVVAV